ncbi:MAG: NepR family anti-sigma factor [Elstera sp.]
MTSPPQDDRASPKPPLKIDGKLQAHIGEQLRTYYAKIAAEPVPDRFKALLDQLENAETSPPVAPAPQGRVTPNE